MTADILCAVPYQCGDNDCTAPGTWHKGTYWHDSANRFSYDEFSDGDHETVDETDLPTPDAEVKAWADYRLWALDNQQDPLNEFMYGVPAPDSEQAATIRQEAAANVYEVDEYGYFEGPKQPSTEAQEA